MYERRNVILVCLTELNISARAANHRTGSIVENYGVAGMEATMLSAALNANAVFTPIIRTLVNINLNRMHLMPFHSRHTLLAKYQEI